MIKDMQELSSYQLSAIALTRNNGKGRILELITTNILSGTPENISILDGRKERAFSHYIYTKNGFVYDYKMDIYGITLIEYLELVLNANGLLSDNNRRTLRHAFASHQFSRKEEFISMQSRIKLSVKWSSFNSEHDVSRMIKGERA